MINTNTITRQEEKTAEILDINSKFLGLDDLEALANTLSQSQGFYGRLLADLQELDADARQQLNNTIKKTKIDGYTRLDFMDRGIRG